MALFGRTRGAEELRWKLINEEFEWLFLGCGGLLEKECKF